MENNMNIEELLKKMEEESGGEPKPMKLLAGIAPDVVFEHARSKTVDALEYINSQV